MTFEQCSKALYMTRHEKTGLMYTKYTSSYYGTYLLYCLRYYNSLNCIRLPITCCINDRNCIRLQVLLMKLFKFKIYKCGQILCAHKPYFLMPGHNYVGEDLLLYFDQFGFPTNISQEGAIARYSSHVACRQKFHE